MSSRETPTIERHFTHHNFNNGAASAIYLPINGTAEGAATALANKWLIPYRGRIVKAVLQCDATSMGVTTCTLVEQEVDTHAAVATVDVDTADAPFTFRWSGARFEVGGLSLKVDPTGNFGNTHVVIVYELEIDD